MPASPPARKAARASTAAPQREAATRDADKTRLNILEAAEAEFAAKGLAGARVDVVAEEAGANKRMIYYYFGSKEDLYLAVLERVYTDMRVAEAELALEAMAPLAAITCLTEFKFDYPAQHPHLIPLLNSENMLGGEYLRRSLRLREMQISLIARWKPSWHAARPTARCGPASTRCTSTSPSRPSAISTSPTTPPSPPPSAATSRQPTSAPRGAGMWWMW